MDVGLLIALGALALLAGAPFGTRAGLWSWAPGLFLFAAAGGVAALALIVSAVTRSLAGIAIAAAVLLLPVRYLIALKRAPRTNRFETATDLDTDPATAFDRALAAARALRWEITDANRGAGRIEAVDTSRWFGFQDDIVIEVAGSIRRTRMTVCSRSRVGRSDLGVNASRVQRFLAAFDGS